MQRLLLKLAMGTMVIMDITDTMAIMVTMDITMEKDQQ